MRAAFLVAILGLPLPALGQVTTNDQALESLQPPPKPAASPPAAAAHGKPHRSPAHTHALPSAPARRLPVPQVPAAAPANPVILPPPFVMPAHAPPPPPTVVVKTDAPGAVIAIPGGTRITFGPGVADLNEATVAELRAIAAAAIANPAMIVSITGWAPGTADDPSTPRRLSLDRALAARAVLIKAGVVSEHIRAIAKGTLDIGKDVPDRLDVFEILPQAAPPGK